jgi:hypothetical protein
MGIIDVAWITASRAISLPSMPIPIPDFETEVLEVARKNMAEVIPLLDARDEGMLEKIYNFSVRFGFSQADVEAKIRSDKMFLARFAKDPGKQKIHEKIAARFIEQLPSVRDFKSLGHNALQLVGGTIMKRADARMQGATGGAKSLDFEWISCGIEFYASHKYTKDSGGAQDNQYRDLKEFIQEASKSGRQGRMFLAIADGPYYAGNDAEAGVSKIQRLKDLANKRNVFALSCAELEQFLKDVCSAQPVPNVEQT